MNSKVSHTSNVGGKKGPLELVSEYVRQNVALEKYQTFNKIRYSKL